MTRTTHPTFVIAGPDLPQLGGWHLETVLRGAVVDEDGGVRTVVAFTDVEEISLCGPLGQRLDTR